MEKIKITLEEGVKVPEKAKKGDEGYDLKAHKIVQVYKGSKTVSEKVLKNFQENFEKDYPLQLRGFERALISTGIKLQLPEETEAQIRPRSGKALKEGLMVANSPGTIDSNYRGDVGIIVYNSTPFIMRIHKGDKIAQMVIKNSVEPEFEVVENLDESVRNGDGFGSTDENKE